MPIMECGFRSFVVRPTLLGTIHYPSDQREKPRCHQPEYTRQLYQAYPKRDALRLELSRTHYRSLIRIKNPSARDWYAEEGVFNS